MQSDFYKQYMKSDKWQQIKDKRLEIDNYTCVMCGRHKSNCKSLQVHHITYARLGSENVYTDLVSLCGTCHVRLHNYYNRCKGA